MGRLQTSCRSGSNFKMQNPGLEKWGCNGIGFIYISSPYFEGQTHLKRGFQLAEQLLTQMIQNTQF